IIELENIDPLPQSILLTTILLVSQATEPTLQQTTNLTTLDSEFESINDEFDEQSDNEFGKQLELYKGQRFKMVEEAYVKVELFAYSNAFGIQKGCIEKDTSDVHEISRSFVYHYAGKPQNKDKLHKTEGSGSCQTDCKWKMQDDDNDSDTAFIDNAFDYPLAHSLALFKQVEDKVVKIWESFSKVIVFSLAAKFSINFVAKCWLLEKYKDKDLGIQLFVNLSTVFLSESTKVSTPITILPSNEFSSLFSAINIAIKKNDLNVLKFLKTYILQNNYSLVENTTNASASDHKTTRYQLALKNQSSKAQKKQSKSYAKHVNKACNSMIMYEFCSGHGHKKELHDYDNVEKKKNESEWVGLSSSESDIEIDTDK
ncbi:37399_t:CDS:2, partial [Gigaspora margarita]